MKTGKTYLAAISALVLICGIYSQASAHCDTLDGPVVQDARKALDAKDVTPVLKWVQAKDEKTVKAAFKTALASQGKTQQQGAEQKFFSSLVRIHRAGEGAPFTGLKPAGSVEPVIAQADKSLQDGAPEALVSMVNEAVKKGIQERYARVAEAYKHKDESVQKGREFVAAYVEYTHYVERLQLDAEGQKAHHGEHKKHGPEKHKH